MSTPVTNRSLLERVQGVLRLDADTYEEIEADPAATTQAAMVVAAAAVAGAIGSIVSGVGVFAIGAVIAAFLGWLIWAAVAYFVGTRFFGGNATLAELLRTLGFAQAPNIINVLGIIPLLGALAGPVSFIWVLLTSVVAIRQGLDLSTEKAILTAVITAAVLLAILFVPATLLGIGLFALR